jgi:hypothetical protein
MNVDITGLFGSPIGDDKNSQLQALLRAISAREVARRWAQSLKPLSDLERECAQAAADPDRRKAFDSYLLANPVVVRSVHTFLAHLVASASIKPQQVAGPERISAQAGSRFASWLPTYLVVDGPLGRFLRAADSPLNILLREQHRVYPVLAQARDTFNSDLFRLVRNGVGHWAFGWERRASEGMRLVCYDPESGAETTSVSVLEANGTSLGANGRA